MHLLESATQRDRVKRLIVDQLEGRGEPPRGWSKEAIFADYVLTLGEYDEDILANAATIVRQQHVRTTWPLAGEYRVVCEKLGGKTRKAEPLTDDQARAVRSAHAYDYVSRRLSAGDGRLMHRAIHGGWVREVRKFLFELACEQLRNGTAPEDIHIAESAIEAQVETWEVEYRARVASWALQPRAARRVEARAVGTIAQQVASAPQSAPDEPRRQVSDLDLDEEIPLPSENDYGAEPAA